MSASEVPTLHPSSDGPMRLALRTYVMQGWDASCVGISCQKDNHSGPNYSVQHVNHAVFRSM